LSIVAWILLVYYSIYLAALSYLYILLIKNRPYWQNVFQNLSLIDCYPIVDAQDVVNLYNEQFDRNQKITVKHLAFFNETNWAPRKSTRQADLSRNIKNLITFNPFEAKLILFPNPIYFISFLDGIQRQKYHIARFKFQDGLHSKLLNRSDIEEFLKKKGISVLKE
jgi:hypothetical protein